MAKRLLLIAGILMLSVIATAEPWFGVEYGVDLGWADATSVGYEIDNGLTYSAVEMEEAQIIFTNLDARFWLWKTVFVGGGTTVLTRAIRPLEAGGYSPYFLNYVFEAGLYWNMAWSTATLRFTHECTHPQLTYAYARTITSMWGEGSTNRLTLEFDFHNGSVPD